MGVCLIGVAGKSDGKIVQEIGSWSGRERREVLGKERGYIGRKPFIVIMMWC
jgi:hypothetical protein